MGDSAYFDLHYGITSISLEVNNVELAKSADKTHVCSLASFFAYKDNPTSRCLKTQLGLSNHHIQYHELQNISIYQSVSCFFARKIDQEC